MKKIEKIEYNCAEGRYNCCEGEHEESTVKTYFYVDEAWPDGRYIKLCKNQTDNAKAYGWANPLSFVHVKDFKPETITPIKPLWLFALTAAGAGMAHLSKDIRPQNDLSLKKRALS